jgi:hypothetical protein
MVVDVTRAVAGVPGSRPDTHGRAAMTIGDEKGEVSLRLTRAEALVLFEWLARVEAAGNLPVEDAAEQKVMWRIEGQLETMLLEPLGPNYREAVDAARREVRGSED